MIKKQLAFIQDWIEHNNVHPLLSHIITYLDPKSVAQFLRCNKQLYYRPILPLILKHQLTSTTPYNPLDLLLLVKAHPPTTEDRDKCVSILNESATDEQLALLETGTPLSSDKQREFIRFYHLSSSPLSPLQNSERATQLANNIQSYINDNLPDENDALFVMIVEVHKGKKEKYRHKKDITQMIIDHPLLVFAKDKDGNTTLYRAARRGPEDAVTLLIEKGADVNANNTHGYTPLHGAASRGRSAKVTLLLDNSADVNATSNREFTPLHEAAFRSDPSVVQALLNAGSNKEAINADGNTPLRIAQSQGHQNIVRLLQKGEQKTQTPDCCILM